VKLNVLGPIAGVVVGLCLGAIVGAWLAHLIQRWALSDPILSNLPLGLEALLGGLFASGGFNLGRWLSGLRQSRVLVRTVLTEAVMTIFRVASAAIGLFIGIYAALWTAGLATDLYEPYAKGLEDRDWFTGNAFVVSCLLWGGLLAAFGYRLGRSLPAAVSWTGLFLGLLDGIYAAPSVADLYPGPIPSDDFLGEIEITALLVSSLVAASLLAIAGYRLGLLLERKPLSLQGNRSRHFITYHSLS
jgi:hypothetical protein